MKPELNKVLIKDGLKEILNYKELIDILDKKYSIKINKIEDYSILEEVFEKIE
jgi:hypothetical protein